jgi:protoporphyrinogen oxidase
MLFKKRPRRKDVHRSFTLEGGLGSIADGVAAQPAITVTTGARVARVERDAEAFRVVTAEGTEFGAPLVAIAAPASVAAEILRAGFPDIADQLALIRTATVESIGVAVEKAKLSVEPVAGIVPVGDIFYSAVTRDTVPDERYRGFAFHFKPGQDTETRLNRIAEVLGVQREDLLDVTEKQTPLPSPTTGHEAITAEIDRLLAGQRLAITGNYFAGLAIEDCVARSTQELARLLA